MINGGNGLKQNGALGKSLGRDERDASGPSEVPFHDGGCSASSGIFAEVGVSANPGRTLRRMLCVCVLCNATY